MVIVGAQVDHWWITGGSQVDQKVKLCSYEKLRNTGESDQMAWGRVRSPPGGIYRRRDVLGPIVSNTLGLSLWSGGLFGQMGQSITLVRRW